MIRLDPQYRLVFGAGGEIDATPTWRDGAAGRDAVARRRRQRCPLPGRQPRKARRASSRCSNPFDRLARTCCGRAAQGLLPLLRPWRSLDTELAATSRTRACASRSRSSRSTWACRPSAARACSRSCRSSSTSTACGTRSAAARRQPRRWPGGRRWASTSASASRSRRSTSRAARRRRAHRGPVGADAVVVNADFARAMQRLVPDRLRRRWTDRKLAKQEVLLLDLHALPRGRRPLRRAAAPHDLHRPDYRATSTTSRAPRAFGGPVVLRPERLRHRSDAGAGRGTARSTCWCR
jgi:phytoene desaturase